VIRGRRRSRVLLRRLREVNGGAGQRAGTLDKKIVVLIAANMVRRLLGFYVLRVRRHP